ncbi:hypothetical protein K501DRAFT_271842 [Backusella circina FSU 941]|nr:hypothetical protein K501DRAFT_271842 [Backusella circina FSU 941]
MSSLINELSSEEDDEFRDSISESLSTTQNKRHKRSGVKPAQNTSNGQKIASYYIGDLDEAMLFTCNSPLLQLDLKPFAYPIESMIPIWLDKLPLEDYTQLLTLFPGANKTHENTLAPEFLSNAFDQWENTLLSGGFSQNSTRPNPTASAEQDSFKDENYEKYWGERLEKNQKALKKAVEAAARRGRRKD